MTKFFCAMILVIGLVAGFTSSGYSQRPTEAQPLVSNNDRLMTARQLMRNSNWEAAAAMLEVIYESEPDNQIVINLLKNCYGQLKQAGKAEALVRRQLEQSPQNLTLRLELAEALSNQGLQDKASVAYREAEALLTSTDTSPYVLVVRSELSHDQQDAALTLIERIRKETKDSTLFALEHGSVRESRKEYAAAIKEYLPILVGDTTMEALEVERRIVLLLDFPESSPEVEKILIAETQRGANPRVVKLLADYYIKANRFDQAFLFATRRDSLEHQQGQSLLYLMRQCYDRKMYAEAAKYGEWVLSRYGAAPTHIETRFIYARALAMLGRTSQAIAMYDTVVARTPREADKSQALYEIGDVYFAHLNDYAKALRYFDSVVTGYRVGMGYIESERCRPFCYLRMGNLDEARKAFTFLHDHPLTDDLSEETSYYLGLISFFKQEYDSSEAALRKLMVEYPNGFYVNDALQLVLVLTEAKEVPELLSDYGQALFAQERREYESTRTWLDRISRNENSALADVALYRLTLVNLQVADTAAALESINRLDSGFAESYYRPYGLKLKADVMSGSAATVESAKVIYKQLLELYPNYPFASEVRKRLKQLETDFKMG